MSHVPFGAKSDPVLLAAIICQHLHSVSAEYPTIAAPLTDHFYVYGLVVGLDSVNEARNMDK